MIHLGDTSLGDLFPWLSWVDVIGKVREFKRNFTELDRFFDEVIAEPKEAKKEEEDEKKDLVDLKSVKINLTLSSTKILQSYPNGMILDMFLGGNDTTSTTMKWAMSELTSHPRTMEKVQEEIRTVRDPQVWERAEEFMPERFEEKEIDFKGQDFECIPFGSRRRICPRMAFGLASIDYELANLLYWFDWKLPESVSELDMGETFGLVVKKTMPLYLEPKPYLVPI
ncbi:hypothetical protein K1719_020078 [Acacia pycnantha]|nr:hypothetical protein K1719_020078 [Acacia pycnantha]